METLKKVVKGGVVLGIVGVLLALAAPALATMIGEATLGPTVFAQAMETPVIWTGVFFGAFGAINAAVEPMMDWAFGADKHTIAAVAPVKVAVDEHSHSVALQNTQLQPNIDISVDMNAANYTQMVEAQRAANAGHLQLVK